MLVRVQLAEAPPPPPPLANGNLEVNHAGIVIVTFVISDLSFPVFVAIVVVAVALVAAKQLAAVTCSYQVRFSAANEVLIR